MNVFTHNGNITLTNPKTGGHRTLSVRTVRKGALEGKRIVSVLIGQNNEEDYLPVGFIGKTDVSIWNRYRGTQYEKVVNCLKRIEELGLIVNFEGTCRVCNRRLTTLESVSSGIGPECAKKI